MTLLTLNRTGDSDILNLSMAESRISEVMRGFLKPSIMRFRISPSRTSLTAPMASRLPGGRIPAGFEPAGSWRRWASTPTDSDSFRRGE